MVGFQSVLSAVADFLKEAQNIGLIKEYVLTEINQNEDVPDAHDLICKFVNIIKGLPVNSKESAEHMPSLTAESNNITTNETAEVTKKSECPAKEVLIQMEIDKSEATTEMVSSPTSKTSSEKTVDGNESHVNKNLVQIQADESEVNRRISAFMSRKRKEVDEWNVQEFCSRSYIDEINQPGWEGLESCARVDTVFVPRSGCKSHVKVSKVENRWGPHLQAQIKKIKQEPGEETEYQQNSSLQAVEERLQNMESHLKLKTESSRTNIFQRLKNLEDRILFLEGISPDYFHIPGTDYQSPKKKHQAEKEKMYSSWSIDDIQKRILTLKETIKTKAYQIKSEPLE